MHVFYDVFHLLVNLFFITPIFAQKKYAAFATGNIVLLLITVIVIYYEFVNLSPFIQKFFGVGNPHHAQ